MSESPSPTYDPAVPDPGEAVRSGFAWWRGTDRTTLIQEVATAAHVGLAALLIAQFDLESVVFQQLAYLTFAGYVVHLFLPRSARLPFFVALSLVGIWLVLGWVGSAWLVGAGLVLIGACHLPVPFAARVGALLAIAGALAMMRAGLVPAPWSEALWPILGSLFMFRLIIYLYDLRTAKIPTNPLRSLAYFFLLPNVCFPLFPVIDYSTFCRTYDGGDSLEGRQTGVRWILRGIFHLIVYRLIYLNLTLAPSAIDSVGGLVQFLVSNFLLYLRVSGQFHLAIGMLRLFGFKLPETHHLYYLASGFNDFWRRINIYWKDFMMKIVFYPTFFRLKSQGSTRALVLSTIVVFVVTWMLHSYQWYWILGSFPLTWQDALFWTILCICVIANSLRETSSGRERSLRARAWSLQKDGLRALRVGVMFAFMCVLWSMWTSESLREWVAIWPSAVNNLGDVATLAALALVVVAGAALAAAAVDARAVIGLAPKRVGALSIRGAAVANTGIIAVLLVVGWPLAWEAVGGTPARVAASMRESGLSAVDQTRLEHGYYERLLNVQRMNTQLWEVLTRQPAEQWELFDTDAGQITDRFVRRELLPSQSTMFLGHPVTTNRWAMRDVDYEQQKPDGTYRIALLGASGSMGWGIGDGETYETHLERRLNEATIDGRYPRYEILNFSVAGFEPLAQAWSAEHRVPPFQPDALFLETLEPRRTARALAERVAAGTEIPYPYLQNVIRRSEVDAGMHLSAIERGLRPYEEKLLAWSYESIAERCREEGMLCVALLLPSLAPASIKTVAETAEEAGFVVVDLTWVIQGWDVDVLVVSETDNHPSAWAHQLYTTALFDHVQEDDRIRASLFGYEEP